MHSFGTNCSPYVISLSQQNGVDGSLREVHLSKSWKLYMNPLSNVMYT